MTDYNKCFVGYLDILKFSYLVEKVEAYSLDDLLGRLKEDLLKFYPERQKIIRYVFVSDSLLLFTENDSKESFDCLIGATAQLMVGGIAKNFPIRGAISHGNFYFNNSTKLFFGPALVDAVKYEKIQNWMGVILTPNCAEFVKTNKYNLNSQQIVQYDVPITECLETNDNSCEVISRSENALCVDWTKNFFYEPTSTSKEIGKVLLEDLFSWPATHKKLKERHAVKLDNTYNFLKYCRQ